MGSQNDTATDSRPSEWYESNAAPTEELDVVRLNAARAKAADEMAAAIARELNGPLTALLLYMGEIKHHSDQLAPVTGDRAYLQRVVENALVQTERVCGLVKQLAGSQTGGLPIAPRAEDAEPKLTRASLRRRLFLSAIEAPGLSREISHVWASPVAGGPTQEPSVDRMQQRRTDEVRRVARTELPHRHGAMALEGARADLHSERTLLVRITLAYQPQHLALALGQPLLA